MVKYCSLCKRGGVFQRQGTELTAAHPGHQHHFGTEGLVGSFLSLALKTEKLFSLLLFSCSFVCLHVFVFQTGRCQVKTGKQNHFFYIHMQILPYLKVISRSILTIYLYRLFSVNAVMLKLSHTQTSIFPTRRALPFFAQNQHFYHSF